MEGIEESKDPADNKNIWLARDIKSGLNSSTKNKNTMKEEIPEDVFICSVRPA